MARYFDRNILFERVKTAVGLIRAGHVHLRPLSVDPRKSPQEQHCARQAFLYYVVDRVLRDTHSKLYSKYAECPYRSNGVAESEAVQSRPEHCLPISELAQKWLLNDVLQEQDIVRCGILDPVVIMAAAEHEAIRRAGYESSNPWPETPFRRAAAAGITIFARRADPHEFSISKDFTYEGHLRLLSDTADHFGRIIEHYGLEPAPSHPAAP